MKEQWSWLKWLQGHVSISRYGKDFGTIIRICIIGVVGFAIFLGAVAIKNKFTSKPLEGNKHIDESSIASNAGTINQEDSHETVTVVHNHSPLENGVLGLIFGAKDQTVKEDVCTPPKAVIGVRRDK